MNNHSLGEAIREFAKKQHSKEVKNASSMVLEFAKEGMSQTQIEEMLFSTGYDKNVITEALWSGNKEK
jgi:hypothetical protein